MHLAKVWKKIHTVTLCWEKIGSGGQEQPRNHQKHRKLLEQQSHSSKFWFFKSPWTDRLLFKKEAPTPKSRRSNSTKVCSWAHGQGKKSSGEKFDVQNSLQLYVCACVTVLQCDLCVSCLFLGAGWALGPGPKLCQLAVDWTGLVITGSLIRSLTELPAAAYPIIVVILKVPVKRCYFYKSSCRHRLHWVVFHNSNWKQPLKNLDYFSVAFDFSYESS